MSLRTLDWNSCRTFLAILRGGNLSAAARALGVAHPTVRRHLEDMEEALGATLFTRSPSGLVPTETALQLREPAEAMESAADSIQRTASADVGAISGSVRISASEIVGLEVLPPMLSELRLKHPGLAVELRAINQIDDLLRRDTDIAVRMAQPKQVDLTARKLGDVKLGFFAHEDWLRVYGSPKSIEAAITERCLIGYDRDLALLQAFSSRGLAISRDAFSFRCDSDLGQLAALKAGLGIGICQLQIAAKYPALLRVLPSISHNLEIWIATHPNLRHVPRVRETLNWLTQEFFAYLHPSLTRGSSARIKRNRSP